MPWGKYKGEKLHNLSSEYLHWLSLNAASTAEVNNLRDGDFIQDLADDEWRFRERYNCHKGKPMYDMDEYNRLKKNGDFD